MVEELKELDGNQKPMSMDKVIDRHWMEQRKIFLWGPVNDENSRDVVERLLYLNDLDSNKDISLYINSPGGIISAGMTIYDAMKMINADTHTICVGLAASMAAILLSGGRKGKRSIWPNARVMIHQPLISGQIIAPAIDIKIQAEEIRKIREELNKILHQNTGQSIAQIEADTDRDYYLGAQEALAYGVVDQVIDKLITDNKK